MSNVPPRSAATKLHDELSNVILRYSFESEVTVYETIGALEVLKTQMVDSLRKGRLEGGDRIPGGPI